MSPQGAAIIVNKHNHVNSNSQQRLLKRDQNGPDSIEKNVDKNADGIPDLVVVNKDGNPLIVNGYTTTKSKCADDLTYYCALSTKEARKAERLRHLNSNMQPVKTYGRDDYIRDQKSVRYFTYDDVTRPELLSQLGTVVESHPERLLQFYRTTQKTPRSQSVYYLYQKNVFGPTIDDALAELEEVIGRNITGKEKKLYHSELC